MKTDALKAMRDRCTLYVFKRNRDSVELNYHISALCKAIVWSYHMGQLLIIV